MSHRTVRYLFTRLALVLAVAALALPGLPAEAGRGHGRKHPRQMNARHHPHGAHASPYRSHGKVHRQRHVRRGGRHVRRGQGHAAVRRHFAVPRHIQRASWQTYRPYYHRSLYYAPHRHHHRVYRFPVYTSVGLDYQPYAYCDGERFRGHVAVSGPRLSLRVDF